MTRDSGDTAATRSYRGVRCQVAPVIGCARQFLGRGLGIDL